MVEHLRAGEEAAAQRIQAAQSAPAAESEPVIGEAADVTDTTGAGLPPLVHKYESGADGWLEFDRPILYLFAGKGPLVARDLLQFPMSLPDDGYIDVVVQEKVRAFRTMSGIGNTECDIDYSQDDAQGHGRR